MKMARQCFVKLPNIKFDENLFILSRVVKCQQTEGQTTILTRAQQAGERA